MGTNYYVEADVCGHCNRGDPSRHIGKSSAGWCFALHVYPDEGINDLFDWKPIMANARITNEYGDVISFDEMIDIITKRSRDSWEEIKRKRPKPEMYSSWEQFHKLNHSLEGPNGLVRHAIGGSCVEHGSGTWDLITGDFS